MQIAVISDTHLPRGSRRLPEECVERLRSADLILHAGDLMRLPVLRQLEAYGPVVAVHGNVDDGEVRAALPAEATVQRRRGHDRARPRRRARRRGGWRAFAGGSRMRTRSCSGTRTSRCTSVASDGFQIFNPGSPTERRRAPSHTMGIATVAGGQVAFELIVLG